MTDITMTSSKPYIVKAHYEWLSDNDLTPHIMVDVNVYGVMVPMAYVTNGQIVLNVSGGAVGHIVLGKNGIELSARFGGKLEQIVVPYGAIGAIYAKENGVGVSLPIEHSNEKEAEVKSTLSSVTSSKGREGNKNPERSKSSATLKVIK